MSQPDTVEMQKVKTGGVEDEGPFRYAAYAHRVVRAIMPLKRYLAFTSDVGEAGRPVVHPRIVSASYALTASYITGEVAYAGYQEFVNQSPKEKILDTVARITTFQLVASLGLPFLLIHGGVHATQSLIRRAAIKSPAIQKWAPSGVGLGMIPLMPVYVDHPVEEAVEIVFDKYDFFDAQKKSMFPAEVKEKVE